MIKQFFVLMCCGMFLFGAAGAEELTTVSRWDISVSPYKFELQGEMARSIDEYRTAVNLTTIAPSIDRQIRAETERLRLLLNSRGYYQAKISSEWDEEFLKPRYEVQLEKRYQISSLAIKGNFLPASNNWQLLDIGDPLNAVSVLGQQTRVKKYIEERTCFYNLDVSHQVELNDLNQTGSIVFITDVSDPTVFGQVSFDGANGIDFDFLYRLVDIRPGDCFKRSTIDTAIIALFDTGLFSQVRSSVQRSEAGEVNVKFNVVRRKVRTLSAATGWESDLGLGATVGWVHRNLWGEGQSLALELSIKSVIQSFSADVVVPNFLDRRNRFKWQNTIEKTNIEFETVEYSSTASIERKATNQDYFEYGLGYTQLGERIDGDWSIYRQIRLPLMYQFNNVADPFNPTNGQRASLELEQVWDIDENFTPFFLTGLGGQLFTRLDPNLTLASRVKWNSLWYGDALGSTLQNIPESEWLRAGGSTSIRGYGYESIEFTASDNPDKGGTQRWLVSNELRLRLSETWGVVTFWDVGSVSDQINPLDQVTWFSGAGAGIRFFTRFAPIRLDVAVPMNQDADYGNFVIYVSLGQAF